MAFTGMLCLQIYYGLLLKEHLPRTKEKLERDCLEHHCERSLKASGVSRGFSTPVYRFGRPNYVPKLMKIVKKKYC